MAKCRWAALPLSADDISGVDAVTLRHVGSLRQVGIHALQSISVVDNHCYPHEIILIHLAHCPSGDSKHPGTLLGCQIDSLMGAPIQHRLVIEQCLYTE